jgi:hypothetical protein
VLDALDVLAYVAANTSNIALGTHVEDMFFYTPIMLARKDSVVSVPQVLKGQNREMIVWARNTTGAE